MPDGAIVRTISAGSFEAVTRRLGVLHALKALGVPVWNEATAIERCVDKSTTTFLLATRRAAGSAELDGRRDRGRAQRVVAAEGSGGTAGAEAALRLAGARPRPRPRARAICRRRKLVGDVYYLQRFVGGDGPDYHDFRVFVVEGEPVAAMLRHARDWITNVKRGGRPMPTPLDRELAELAAQLPQARSARRSAASTSSAAGTASPTCWR